LWQWVNIIISTNYFRRGMMDVLTRAVKAARNVIDEPESFSKGEEFQDFVRSQLFTKDDYDMLDRTPNYTKNDYIESSKKPDFKFRSRKTGKEFFVEAKYRSVLYKGAFEFKPYQLRRYRIINKEAPVYIVIGVGKPDSPEQVFLIPVKNIRDVSLVRSVLNEYQIPLNPVQRCKKAIDAIVESSSN
jgi:hypothetical protein